MLPLSARAVIIIIVALIPTIVAVVSLWICGALAAGGPLVLVLFAPAVGLSGAYIAKEIKAEKKRRKATQEQVYKDETEEDFPPKYTDVITSCPKTSCSHQLDVTVIPFGSSKPPTPITVSDKMNRDTPPESQKGLDLKSSPVNFSVTREQAVSSVKGEPLLSNPNKKRVKILDTSQDPHLPTYEEAVDVLSRV